MRRPLPIALAAVLIAGCAAITGCTAAAPAAAPTPTQSVPADPALIARFPKDLTADTAKTETVRLAAAIDALLPADIVVHVDDTSQLVAATATAKSYYGVLQIVTLDATVDPEVVVKAVAKRLTASGWSQLETSSTAGVRLISLSSGSLVATSWFLVLSGDPRVAGQPVMHVQLASPDLP